MTRLLQRLLALTLSIGSLASGSIATASIARPAEEEPRSLTARDWRGGPVSLPIGREHMSHEILDAARVLPQAQDLTSLFYSRGYTRREDRDMAGGNDSLSYAILAWQKPGIPIEQEVPIIRLISKYYFDADARQRVVATQAFGGVLRDSAGTLATYDSGPDAPAAVVELVPVGTAGSIAPEPGKLPQARDDVWAYRFSYRETSGPAAKAAVKQVWDVSCRFRRGVTRLGLYIVGGVVPAMGGGTLGFIYASIAVWSLNEWIDNSWHCQ